MTILRDKYKESMSLSPETSAPVLSLKRMKRAFYIFIAVNIIIAVAAVVMFFLFDPFIKTSLNDVNPWYFFFMFIGFTIINFLSSKKVLKFIRETADPVALFSKYEDFYKRKTIANVFGIIITGILCVITAKYVFLFMLTIQLIIPITLYPRKKMLATLFQNNEAQFV
jgi:hypothetical protein